MYTNNFENFISYYSMFKKKYLKYKIKYLNLKKKIGGAYSSIINPDEGKLVQGSFPIFHLSHKKNRQNILDNGLLSPINLGETTGLDAPEEDEINDHELSDKIFFSKYESFEAYKLLEEKNAAYILKDGETYDDLDIWILNDIDFINQNLKYGLWNDEYYIQQNEDGPIFGHLLDLADEYKRWELGIGKDLKGFLRDDFYNYYGYDEDGYDRYGYDEDGYDRDGYDEDGYDEDGYDEDGYNRYGYDEDGYFKYVN